MNLGGAWQALLEGMGALLALFYDLIPSYGVAIILLTVAVRVAMLPLTIKQTRSMQQMQKLQPEIKRLQAKHKGDRQKLNEETMKLYHEHGFNPLGGCLPLLLQFPVFIALFQVFSRCPPSRMVKQGKRMACDPRFVGTQFLPAGSALSVAIQSGQAGFLGMELGYTPSAAYRELGIVSTVSYAILVLLMGVTTWLQQKQMTAAQPPGQQAGQAALLGKIMPVFLTVISLNFPVALTLYWTASNMWTIGQQYLMMGRGGSSAATATTTGSSGPKAENEEVSGNGARVGKPKGSGARKRRKGR